MIKKSLWLLKMKIWRMKKITSNDIDLTITAIPLQTEIDSVVIGSGESKKPSLQPGKLAKGSIVLMP